MDIHAYIQSGIIESYLLGIAGEEEKAELDLIRRQYPEVEQAIHDAEEWLYGITSSYTTTVPPEVRSRIFAVINEDKPRPAVVKITPVRTPVYKYIAAASVILLMGSVAANLVLYNKYQRQKQHVLALQQQQQTLLAENNVIQAKMKLANDDLRMIVAAGASKITMEAVPGRANMKSVLVLDASGQQLLMVMNQLPVAPSGKQYQLWAIVKGKPVNAGMISDCDPYCRFGAVPGAEAYAVTLEKTGGSIEPTIDQMYVFGKVSS